MDTRKIITTIIKLIVAFYSLIIIIFSITYIALLPIILCIIEFLLILSYSITKGLGIKTALYISTQVAKENLKLYRVSRMIKKR